MDADSSVSEGTGIPSCSAEMCRHRLSYVAKEEPQWVQSHSDSKPWTLLE